jgi:hypothetical protein
LGLTCLRVLAVVAAVALLGWAWESLLGGWLFLTAVVGASLQGLVTVQAMGRGRRQLMRHRSAVPDAIWAAVGDLSSAFALSTRRLVVNVCDLGGRKHHGIPTAAATSGLGGAVLFVDEGLAAKAARAGPGSQDDDEVRAVMAHELAHVFAQDVAVKVTSSLAMILIGWCTVLGATAAAGGDMSGSRVGLLGMASALVVFLLDRWLGRSAEYAADARAGKATGRPLALAAALERDFYGTSRGWKDWLATHPPTDKRCVRLREQARTPPAG